MTSDGTGASPSVPRSQSFSDADYRDQADFRCALRQFLSFSEQAARNAGITPQQHLLLLIVRGHRSYPKVNIGAIADGLQVRHHSASLLVDRGVKRGLLRRTGDPDDRRRALVSLTDEGQEILDRVLLANREQLNRLEEVIFRDSLQDAIRRYTDARGSGDGRP